MCSFGANLVFPTEGYDPSALEAVQLEDGSTAYIHHPIAVASNSTILAVQTEVGLEDLAAEDEEGFSADTVVALEQYASKVSTHSLTLPIPCTCPLLGQGQPWTWTQPRLHPLPFHPGSPQLSVHMSSSKAFITAWPGPLTATYTQLSSCCLQREGPVRNSDII